MSTPEIQKLQTMRSQLRSEIIFEHISTLLLQEEIIDREEYQRIKSQMTDPERIDILLDVLPKKGDEGYNKFLTVLDKAYPWLAENLRTAVVQSENNGTKDKCILNKGEMMDVVRRNARAVERWTSLAHSLGLTKQVVNIRVRVCVYGEQYDMCLLYLLREWVGMSSKEATLNRLIEALKEEGLNDVVDELEERFG